MTTTFIDTNKCDRKELGAGLGVESEILNGALCGAQNVVGKLRWLDKGDAIEVGPVEDTHQLLYLMEGEGTIELDGKPYDVNKGKGLYLGPKEKARIGQRGNAPLKLFQLIVPKVND
ncbi:MAG: AraC family ligand binding domain-containing protein [Rhodobiaceae bacterium]|nr:AraC family ligand binding domain-containing protein [Rhodobiaceae bacterium]